MLSLVGWPIIDTDYAHTLTHTHIYKRALRILIAAKSAGIAFICKRENCSNVALQLTHNAIV